jgi:hypothetical protein
MAEETPQFSAEQPEMAQSQSAQTPVNDADTLTQGMRVFFARLQAQQHEQEAAREQSRGL